MLWLGHSSLVCSFSYFHKIIRISWQKRSWIRPHRNTNNLAEVLRANSKITIKKEVSNCIVYLLFIKTYYIIFDIFYPTSPITSTCNIFTFSSIKTEIKLLSTITSSLRGNLVYKAEKSKLEIEVSFLRLLRPFIASINVLLSTQKLLILVKSLHLSLYVCICLKTNEKLML